MVHVRVNFLPLSRVNFGGGKVDPLLSSHPWGIGKLSPNADWQLNGCLS